MEEIPAESSSTTESQKKLAGGIVRPFRSNDDLLAALKRRREQASNRKSFGMICPIFSKWRKKLKNSGLLYYTSVGNAEQHIN